MRELPCRIWPSWGSPTPGCPAPRDVALLERLVRIPSVRGPDPDSEALARSAQAVADELDAARLD
jgi:hypothetical protein